MGNTIGGKDRKVAKVMKITGETLKYKAPVEAGEVLKDYPGLVLLESESVKHYGVRAKPLGAHEGLRSGRLYFLVELPKEKGVPRRVRSAGINLSAKERLENLMLARRSASDLSIVTKDMPNPRPEIEEAQGRGEEVAGSGVRVRVRLPKEEVERLMKESRDGADAAEKIMRLYIDSNKNDDDHNSKNNKNNDVDVKESSEEVRSNLMEQQQLHCNNGRRNQGPQKREQKRVSFLAAREGGTQTAVAS